MYPIIGIISRKSLSESGHNIDIAYSDIIYSVTKSKGIPIVISNNNIDKYLNICDGFILQGGDDIDNNNLEIIKLLYDKNIPLLGICLGMQEMSIINNGILYDIDNHKNDSFHEIVINENSLLYKILGVGKTMVNSRHKSAIKDTNFLISSRSNDNIIESVEDDSKKFFIGLQWHPENMYNYDINSRKIFDYFIKVSSKLI